MKIDRYPSFQEMARHEREGADFECVAVMRPSAALVVIAPHGGGIEPHTCEIARRIAGQDYSFYAFRGTKPHGNEVLHLTSHLFDEPRGLNLVSSHRVAIALHGFVGQGEEVLLGGRHRMLKMRLAEALGRLGVAVRTDGHPYPGFHPENICNRGSEQRGLQIEMSAAFQGGTQVDGFVSTLRDLLLAEYPPEGEGADMLTGHYA